MRRFVQAFSAASGLPASLPAAAREQLGRLPDRYNVCLGQAAGLLLMRDSGFVVEEMSWGFIPSWEPRPATHYSTQTARLERAPHSPMYRSAWASRRCLLPMSGYYKWDRNSAPRQPYFIQSTAGEVLFAAALWSRWTETAAQETASIKPVVLSFAVLTHANAAIPEPLVPDGPVFLEPGRLGDWLLAAPDAAEPLLMQMRQPALEAYAVSRRVANRKLDDYSLLEPLRAVEEFETGFDQDELDEDEHA